ncbi:MAG: hypothetical protein FVQ83_02685 [Chloroflexi bacterium]|nr:hypothetical protein [Chloroflexota bacterium]
MIQEINNANATPATSDIIDLDPGCIYQLDTVDNTEDGNNGLPSVVSPIVIRGHNAVIQRSSAPNTPQFRLFHVADIGDLQMSQILLSNGELPNGNTIEYIGGAILNLGYVNIISSTISDNHAGSGGGIFNGWLNLNADLELATTRFTDNQADSLGGAIYNYMDSEVQILGGTFSGNQAEAGGGVENKGTMVITMASFLSNSATNVGGAFNNESSLHIVRSTVANNTAALSGAAVNSADNLHIYNSTISGNSLTAAVGDKGSAITIISGNSIFSHATITNNSGGGRPAFFFPASAQLGIQNTIIANNPGGDCGYSGASPNINPSNTNLDSDGSCTGFTITADPLLGPLADNGGTNQTHALLAGSPAIDAGLTAWCLPEDQRAVLRPFGPECDLGAYEFTGGGPSPAASDTPTPTLTPTGTITFLPPTATFTSFPPTWTPTSAPGQPTWTPTLTSLPPTWTPTITLAPPTATATTQALGTISGGVWKDSNADGVRQGSEQSYPGVTIRLGQGACPSSGYMSAISAGDGSYSFLNVPAGTYCLFADLAPTCEIYSIITTPNDLTLDFTTGIEGSGWVIPFGFAPYVC